MQLRTYPTALLIACVFASTASAQVAGFGSETKQSQFPSFGDGMKTTQPEQQASAAPEESRGEPRPRRRDQRDADDRPRRQPRRFVAAPSNRPTQSLAAQTDGYVRGLMNQYDKNLSSRLEADELKSLPGNLARADGNSDQVITFEELRTHVMSLNTSTASGSTSAVTQDSTAGRSDEHNSSRKPDGAATENKRVVVELPSRFKSRDADGDGQVAMSEYSRSWTDSLAAEFRRYDQNNDGVITASEAH